MAQAIGRKEPFTGELVRLYETDKNRPGAEARRALAAALGRPEPYIEFGVQHEHDRPHRALELTGDERALLARYRAADHRWRISLRLLAALAVEGQFDDATDVNLILARILGKKPSELRYTSDERVAEALAAGPRAQRKKPARPPR